MGHDEAFGITVLYEPSPAVVAEHGGLIVFDLVAIHGLNGHPFDTWTHKKSKQMWLRDLLPQSIPNIRTMTYGYNASFRNISGHQDLTQISQKLLSELVDLRRSKQEAQRHVIIVCHSLGGIVAKKALLLDVPAEQKNVQNLVYGIIFLGTPHNGSDFASLGKVIADLVKVFSNIKPANQLLEVLQADSKVLYEITQEFRPRATTLKVVSFFETRMTDFKIFKRLIVSAESAVLNIPTEVAIGQNADHREIARFLSLHDRNYRPIVTRLDMFRNDIARQFNTKASENDDSVLNTPYGDSGLFYSPSAPCYTFRGREDVLGKMKQYFRESGLQRTEQPAFALCGLGGSGKTQTALKFAMLNREWYKSGIFFFNADSLTALESDYARHHEALQLGNALNKTANLKKWLSQEEHKDWLLIYDNADDLEAVHVAKYFPRVPWGNIVITTRDQQAIGTVAQSGVALDRLDAHDAVDALLAKVGIESPSEQELGDAHIIVELIGCLPLAMDQAGAFIRSRRRTLSDYKRLFEERQYDILKLKPRLADYDKTVLTTWEMNFGQVEHDTPAASDLLLLFCFLDGSNIPEIMLQRGSSPQNRWNGKGEIEEIPAKAAGVDEAMVALIQDEFDFDEAIQKLLSYSLIHTDTDTNGSRHFSLHPLVQQCAARRVPFSIQAKWKLQAALLVCHAFPRGSLLDTRYGDMGRLILRHVHRILREINGLVDDEAFSAKARQQLASMLIEASHFSTTPWKQEVMNRAKDLLDEESEAHLHAEFMHRESSLLRMRGKEEESNAVLERFIQTSALPAGDMDIECDARTNAIRGQLIISYSQNLLSTFDLNSAERELHGWQPLNPASPSTMEKAALQARNAVLGRVLRYEGKFETALEYLEEQLRLSENDNIQRSSGWRRVLMSHVADLYCELNRPEDAMALLKPELDYMDERGCLNVGVGRRLQLALFDNLIRNGQYDEAQQGLLKLKRILDGKPDPDKIARRRDFRVSSNLAQIAHLRGLWDEALDHWKESLESLGRDGFGEASGAGVVRYSISYACLRKGNREEAISNATVGKVNLASERRIFTIPLQSYWRDYIVPLVDQELEV